MVAVEAIVKGRVQRVGYRRYLLDVAQELGVYGLRREFAWWKHESILSRPSGGS